ADLDGDANTAEPTPYDLDGQARFFDACFDDPGDGTLPRVDIGAYESTNPAGAGPIIYVNTAATGSDTGGSWPNAFTSLRTALGVASANAGTTQQIWVAAGTYRPTRATDSAARAATFQLHSSLAVYGGFTGNETALSRRDPASHVTTLSGDLRRN